MPRLFVVALLLFISLPLQADPNTDLQTALAARDPAAIRQALRAGAQPNEVRPYAAGLAISELASSADKAPWRDLVRDLAQRGHFPLWERGYPYPYRGSIGVLARNAEEMPLVLELLKPQPAQERCQLVTGLITEISHGLDGLAKWPHLSPIAELLPAEMRSMCPLDPLIGRVRIAADREVLLALLAMGYPIGPDKAHQLVSTQSSYFTATDKDFFDQLLSRLDLLALPDQYSNYRYEPLLKRLLSNALSIEYIGAANYTYWNEWGNYLSERLPSYWFKGSLEQRCTLGAPLAGFWYLPQHNTDANFLAAYEPRHQLARQLTRDFLSHCLVNDEALFRLPSLLAHMLQAGDGDLVAQALRKGLQPNFDNDAPTEFHKAAACSNSVELLTALALKEPLLETFLECLPAPERQAMSQQQRDTLAWLLRDDDVNAPLPFSGAMPLAAAEELGHPEIIAALRAAGATSTNTTEAHRSYWRSQRLFRIININPADALIPQRLNPEDLSQYVQPMSDLGSVLAPHYLLQSACSPEHCGIHLFGRKANGDYQLLFDNERSFITLGEMHQGLRDITIEPNRPPFLDDEESTDDHCDSDGNCSGDEAIEAANAETEVVETVPDQIEESVTPTTWRFNGETYQPLLCEHMLYNYTTNRAKINILPCP